MTMPSSMVWFLLSCTKTWALPRPSAITMGSEWMMHLMIPEVENQKTATDPTAISGTISPALASFHSTRAMKMIRVYPTTMLKTEIEIFSSLISKMPSEKVSSRNSKNSFLLDCVNRASPRILKVGSLSAILSFLRTTSVVGKDCTSIFWNSACVSALNSICTKKMSSSSRATLCRYRFTAARRLSVMATACFCVFTPSFSSILSSSTTDITSE
mmetsp:Transcript_3018/g.7560  ORF Transcript_3018/g.7560 Transcript_3018/m.7560 type:complete len:214 (+) Transcript_3018:317-958(+)